MSLCPTRSTPILLCFPSVRRPSTCWLTATKRSMHESMSQPSEIDSATSACFRTAISWTACLKHAVVSNRPMQMRIAVITNIIHLQVPCSFCPLPCFYMCIYLGAYYLNPLHLHYLIDYSFDDRRSASEMHTLVFRDTRPSICCQMIGISSRSFSGLTCFRYGCATDHTAGNTRLSH